jgi:hypothetical protein
MIGIIIVIFMVVFFVCAIISNGIENIVGEK